MKISTLTFILFGLIFFAGLLLFVIIIYLCVKVRRIRRDVDELFRNKHVNHIGLKYITQNKEAVELRKPKLRRGTGDLSNKKRHHPSSIYLDPGEQVTVLVRNDDVLPDSLSNAGSTQQLGMENILTIQNSTVSEIQATP